MTKEAYEQLRRLAAASCDGAIVLLSIYPFGTERLQARVHIDGNHIDSPIGDKAACEAFITEAIAAIIDGLTYPAHVRIRRLRPYPQRHIVKSDVRSAMFTIAA